MVSVIIAHPIFVFICTHESLSILSCGVQILKLSNDAFPFPLFSDSQRQSLRVQSDRVECGGIWTMEPGQDRRSWPRQVRDLPKELSKLKVLFLNIFLISS